MPAPESIALKDALQSPTVVTAAQVRGTLGTLRPGLMKVSQQISIFQQLLAAAEAAEGDPLVEQKFESLSQTFRALQRQHDKVEEVLSLFARSMREFQAEAADFIQTIDGAA